MRAYPVWQKPHILFNDNSIFLEHYFLPIEDKLRYFFHSFLCPPPFYFFLFYFTFLRLGPGEFFQTWKDSSQRFLGKSYFKLKGTVSAVAKNSFNNCSQKQTQKAPHFSLFIIHLKVCANLHNQSVCRLPPCQVKLNKILIEGQKYLQGHSNIFAQFKRFTSCRILAFSFLANSMQLKNKTTTLDFIAVF